MSAVEASADRDGRARSPGWPTLQRDAFHGFAGNVVETIAPHSEADPVALLVDFLVSFGNAIGAGPHMRVGGAVHTVRENVVLVGRTARARKGQSRAEIREVFAGADPDWSAERVMGGLASGEGLIASVRDGASDDDAGVQDKRLLVHEPEFARVLGVASREGSTLSAIVRECWDSGRLRVMTRRDPLVATGAHVSVLAHVTLEELTRKLTETDAANGFANRFLFVLVDRARLLPSGGALTLDDFGRLGRFGRNVLEQARRVSQMRRSPESEELWAFLYGVIAEQETEGMFGAITARAEAHLLRLSMLYALLDGSSTIEPVHLEAAWAVLCYADESAAFIFGRNLGDPVADRLLDALRALPEGQGMDGTQQRDLFGRHASGARLGTARDLLASLGYVENVSDKTGGRPRVVTFLRCDQSDLGDQTPVRSLSSLRSQAEKEASR